MLAYIPAIFWHLMSIILMPEKIMWWIHCKYIKICVQRTVARILFENNGFFKTRHNSWASSQCFIRHSVVSIRNHIVWAYVQTQHNFFSKPALFCDIKPCHPSQHRVFWCSYFTFLKHWLKVLFIYFETSGYYFYIFLKFFAWYKPSALQNLLHSDLSS